ncbi:MAG: YjgP/YjgQ family permease [Cytophagales bacterium]|nr:YjgP/YjgQ family permease [Cytophagales bacterium]
MKKIDIYILKKLLSTFLFVVVILVVIICVIDFTDKNDNFIRYQVSTDLIVQYYISFAPYFAALLTPITAFIATVLVTAKMAAQTELIAILASGISFRRLMRPYFFAASIIAVVSFYLNGFVIPDGNKFRVDFEMNYISKPYHNSDRNMHIKIGPNDYVYLNRYSIQQEIGYTVTLERFEGYELKEKITARRIHWDSTEQTWQLNDWQRRTVMSDFEVIEEGTELDTLLNLKPADFGNKAKLETTLTMPELQDYIDLQMSRGADDVQIYRIERYIRYMQPFTVIVLCFIALIVSARKSRRGTGFQIALGFLIAFSFVILFVFAQAIAAAGSMHPLLAIWLPNIFFSAVGLLMYNTIPR